MGKIFIFSEDRGNRFVKPVVGSVMKNPKYIDLAETEIVNRGVALQFISDRVGASIL